MPRSDVGNQGLGGLVMLIPSFVGPDPNRSFGGPLGSDPSHVQPKRNLLS